MKKVFLIIWADVKFYQTISFTSKFFDKNGYKIYIFYRKPNDKQDFIGKVDFGKNVQLIPFQFSSFNKISYLFFLVKCFLKKLIINPSTIIFYDRKALFCNILIQIIKKRTKLIYHNFDFNMPQKNSIFEKILNKLEFYLAKKVDLLIFASIKIGYEFCNHAFIDLNKKKMIEIKNCFPKNFIPKKSNVLDIFLKEKNLINKKIVCRLGSLGPNQYIENIIKSVKYWNEDLILILGGITVGNFKQKIDKLIEDENVMDKIFVFEFINSEKWFEILFKSKIGICFYDENISTINKHMSRASTKLSNYIFANIPFVASKNKDFEELNKHHNICKLANANDPKEIAEKINFIYENENIYIELKQNSKKSFVQEFNFNNDFDQLLQILK